MRNLRSHVQVAVVLATVLGAPPCLFAQTKPAAELTVQEVVARNLAARGGEERLLAVRSARLSGTVQLHAGMDAPMRMEWRRPGQVRVEFDVQGMSAVRAYDGQVAWAVTPFFGNSRAEPLIGHEETNLVDAADFDGPLVDSMTKGIGVTLAGLDSFEGTQTYRLDVRRRDGRVISIHLDAESFLEIARVDTVEVDGESRTAVTLSSDYRSVDGVTLAFFKERRVAGARDAQITSWRSVQFDVDLALTRFTMPAGPATKER